MLPGARKVVNGSDMQVVGYDGPINGYEFTAQTGFYVRKYLDPAVGSGQRGVQSEVWFVRYRFGEMLLIAAEAAFELSDKETAKNYLNTLRARAGLTIPLTAADITFDRIVHERRVELAFEGLYLFDMKRWRLAHNVWDGSPMSATDLGQQHLEVPLKGNTNPGDCGLAKCGIQVAPTMPNGSSKKCCPTVLMLPTGSASATTIPLLAIT